MSGGDPVSGDEAAQRILLDEPDPAGDDPADAPTEEFAAPPAGTDDIPSGLDEQLPVEGTGAGIAALATGGAALLFLLDPVLGSIAGMAVFAATAYLRRRTWLAACAAAWALVFITVRVLPGPYDSWAGPAAVPVLAGFAGCFLVGWALGGALIARHAQHPQHPQHAPSARPRLSWPPHRRLLAYLGVLLVIGATAAVLTYRGVPPVLAGDPDAARAALALRANIRVGLMAEAWTLGMAVSLLRALTTEGPIRWLYAAIALPFTAGAALGASKNSVLVGVVPAIIAALSVHRSRERSRKPSEEHRRSSARHRAGRRTWAVVAVGAIAVLAAVYLGGQRTMAGSGAFEDRFRATYGGNPLLVSVGSMDLSLSASAETFGRLWAQRDEFEPRHGAYTLSFLGSPGARLLGPTDLYGDTGQLSQPYYMNTATFAAIPLLDYGAPGAAVFLFALGLLTGAGERRLEPSSGPAQQLGRAFVVYFAVFGIYELYQAIYPTWLALVPGLGVLYLLGRRRPA